MNIWPFNKSYPKCLSSIQIEIFESVNQGDSTKLMKLINQHNDVIQHEFPNWKVVPLEIKNGKWQQWYASGLIGLADAYRQCGVTSLIEQLMGSSDDNPISKWQSEIAKAQNELNENQPKSALATISPILIEMEKLSGTAVDEYSPLCYGIIGTAEYKIGNINNAICATEKALELCKKNNDHEGVLAYSNNIKIMKNS
jgi:tetratricopeptide (TPR) repeat protein